MHWCVKRVTFVELDREVVEFSRSYLSEIHRGAFDDPRVETVIDDGRAYVTGSRGRYDVVIMDMTDPVGPSKMLYTREFFAAVKGAMKDDRGLFVMHTESPVTTPRIFAAIHKTLECEFAHVTTFSLFVQMYATLWSIAVCSARTGLTAMTPGRVDRTLQRRNVEGLRIYNGATHRSMQTAFPFMADVRSLPVDIITDRRPLVSPHLHTGR